MRRRSLNPSSLLVILTIAMLMGSFLPLRLSGWTGWLRGPFMTVLAPISGPLASLGAWLRPGDQRGAPVDIDREELQQQLDFYKQEYLRLDKQAEQMRELIEALQEGVSYGPAITLRRLEASRVGADLGAGSIDVSRGSTHGVRAGAVAVATTAPQHLVGLVTDVGPTVSTVHVVTDRRIAPNLMDVLLLSATNVTTDALARAPRCQIRPAGDGTLVGELGAEDAQRLSPGDAAFLDDLNWPPAAQRLICGRVARIEDTENPLFKRVVLKPDLDLMRTRSVILRIPADAASAPTPAEGANP